MPSDKTVVITAGGEGGGGQTQFTEATPESELSLPLRQWRTLVKLRYLLAGACISTFLIWSPWSFFVLGLAVIGLLVLRIDRDDGGWYCEWRFGDDSTARLIRGLVVVGLLIVWLVFWDEALAAAWPEYLDLGLFPLPLRWIWNLHIAWRLAVTMLAGVMIWSYRIFAFRLRAEIADPSWPAPIGVRAPDTGVAFPGAEIRSVSAEPAPLPALPPIRDERVTVDMWRGRGREQWDYDAIPLLGPSRDARARVRQMALLYQGGVAFSEPQMAGTGKPLTGPEFRKLRDEFLRRKWAKWVDRNAHQQGVSLTASGEWVLDALAEGDGASPHPTEGRSQAFSAQPSE